MQYYLSTASRIASISYPSSSSSSSSCVTSLLFTTLSLPSRSSPSYSYFAHPYSSSMPLYTPSSLLNHLNSSSSYSQSSPSPPPSCISSFLPQNFSPSPLSSVVKLSSPRCHVSPSPLSSSTLSSPFANSHRNQKRWRSLSVPSVPRSRFSSPLSTRSFLSRHTCKKLQSDWSKNELLSPSAMAVMAAIMGGISFSDRGIDENTTPFLNTSATIKPVVNNFDIIRMPGDGRCLFHAVTYGACQRSGIPFTSTAKQTEMADGLRSLVADEFVKRREETEWFIEGNFDNYVKNIRKSHVWGGEPELLMMSHVLRTPITVYIRDPKGSTGIISIAEYGQEYTDKGEPISVFYNGSSHYDALKLSDNTGETLSKL